LHQLPTLLTINVLVNQQKETSMAQAPNGGQGKHGGAAGPRTIYAVLQVLDESGQPMLFDKKRVRIVALETSADTMLSLVEGDEHPNAFFIRGKLARRGGGRPAGSQNVQHASEIQRPTPTTDRPQRIA
jgi:hypothetical protein